VMTTTSQKPLQRDFFFADKYSIDLEGFSVSIIKGSFGLVVEGGWFFFFSLQR